MGCRDTPAPGETGAAAQIVTVRSVHAGIPAVPRVRLKMWKWSAQRTANLPPMRSKRGQPVFPRLSRGGTLAGSDLNATSWSTCMSMRSPTIAGHHALASWRQASFLGSPLMTHDRENRERTAKCREFMSAGKTRQEWSRRTGSVRSQTEKCQIQGDVQADSATEVCTKRCCYVSKRDNCRNLRHSALKCHVFRGRSTCSPNSKHFHRISAD